MKMLGLLSVIALVVSLVYAQVKWGPDYSKTFSRLVAQKQTSIIYYFIVFCVFLATFSMFMVTSFIPQFNLPLAFAWIYFLGVVSQLVCVVIPETGGYKTKIHLAAAGIMSASVFAQLILLVFLTHLPLISLVVCILGLSVMSLIWLAIIFKSLWVKYELTLQSLYFASYLIAILFVSYAA